MALESLLTRANEAVSVLTTMGWAPAEAIAKQSTSDMQSICNALASQLQGNPGRLGCAEKHEIFELASKIWVLSFPVTVLCVIFVSTSQSLMRRILQQTPFSRCDCHVCSIAYKQKYFT